MSVGMIFGMKAIHLSRGLNRRSINIGSGVLKSFLSEEAAKYNVLERSCCRSVVSIYRLIKAIKSQCNSQEVYDIADRMKKKLRLLSVGQNERLLYEEVHSRLNTLFDEKLSFESRPMSVKEGLGLYETHDQKLARHRQAMLDKIDAAMRNTLFSGAA
jgi:hypothetical protein